MLKLKPVELKVEGESLISPLSYVYSMAAV